MTGRTDPPDRNWTPDQLRLAAAYGICHKCGQPRYSELRTEGTTKTLVLTCPNGHDVE